MATNPATNQTGQRDVLYKATASDQRLLWRTQRVLTGTTKTTQATCTLTTTSTLNTAVETDNCTEFGENYRMNIDSDAFAEAQLVTSLSELSKRQRLQQCGNHRLRHKSCDIRTVEDMKQHAKHEDEDEKRVQDKELDEEDSEDTLFQTLSYCNKTVRGDINSSVPLTSSIAVSGPMQITSIEGFFNRKRGRPPKNRFVEVYKNIHQYPQAIFTSFKLEKHVSGNASSFQALSDDNPELDYCAPLGFSDTILAAPQSISKRFLAAPRPATHNTTVKLNLGLILDKAPTSSQPTYQEYTLADMKIVDHAGTQELELTKPNHKGQKQHIRRNQRQPNLTLTTRDAHQWQSDVHWNRIASNSQEKTQQYIDSGSPSGNCNSRSGETNVRSVKKLSVVRAVGTFYPMTTGTNKKNTTDALNCTQSAAMLCNGPEGDFNICSAPKQVLLENKDILNATLAMSVKGDEFSMPKDLSTRAQKKCSMQAVCRKERPNLNIAAANGKTTTDETATTSDTCAHNGIPECAIISKQLKQLFEFYQLQLQMLQQQQRKQLPYDSPPVAPVATNNMQYLSILQAAYTNALQQQSTPPSVDSKRQQLHHADCATLVKGFTQSTVAASPVTPQHLIDNRMLGTEVCANKPPVYIGSKNNELIAGCLLATAPQLKNELSSATGYLKFRLSEDCGFEKCSYRQRQSHFHCNRVDCHYSFCNKTRFVQHTARHVRLDTLIGNDFQQYRANMQCGYINCNYNLNEKPSQQSASSNCSNINKSSHFHCLKCTFNCVDTNKLLAHRRVHTKLDYIRSAGFCKVLRMEKCAQRCSNIQDGCPGIDLKTTGYALFSDAILTTVNKCPYRKKHTHYHCLLCGSGLLSHTQLTAHRQKSCKHRT